MRDAYLGADDLVLELGAGKGRLTAELARVVSCVRAVEIDPRLAAGLRGRWPNVEVIEGDAARLRLPQEPFRVVANLPFDRTTDLLHLLLDDPRTPLLQADLIVEWGVAFKHSLPWPSTLNGVIWGALYETSLTRRLPRTAFEPIPAADAGVIVFKRRAEPLISSELIDHYRRFVARGIRHGLRTVSSALAVKRIAGRGAAARDLDTHKWVELFLSQRSPWKSTGGSR